MWRSFSSSSSHFLFPRDFSVTIADRDIINTLLEQLRPADHAFLGLHNRNERFRIFLLQNRFLAVGVQLAVVALSSE